jgi:hypothetical protein
MCCISTHVVSCCTTRSASSGTACAVRAETLRGEARLPWNGYLLKSIRSMSATEASAKRGRGGDADSMARVREAKRMKRAAKRARADARRRRERPVTVPRPVCATAQHRTRLLRDGFVCVPLVPLSSLKDAAGETYTATKWTALAARIAALPELTIFQTADVGAAACRRPAGARSSGGRFGRRQALQSAGARALHQRRRVARIQRSLPPHRGAARGGAGAAAAAATSAL